MTNSESVTGQRRAGTTEQALSGFTLIELLLAISITGVVSTMAFVGFDAAVKANEVARIQADRIQEINLAMTIMARDFRQVQPRPVRDESGDSETAFWGNGSGQHAAVMTRSGWQNPTGTNRSYLQRVEYHHEDNNLLRESWGVLDRSWDSGSYSSTLLSGVEEFSIRFLKPISENNISVDTEWLETWRPDLPEESNAFLPLAVEITLLLSDWGEIKRLYLVTPFWPIDQDYIRLGSGAENL